MLESTTVVGDCVHHWMLATPGPDGTAATCTNCGADRLFAPVARPTLRAPKPRRPKQGATGTR